MAIRKNLALIFGIIIAVVILFQAVARENQVNRTDSANLDSKIEHFSSL
ncbi:MAG TPA: hypothetical protein VGA21_12100 [Cyclobacteriaceae bacterium]